MKRYEQGEIGAGGAVGIGGFVLMLIAGVAVAGMWGCPQYNVYSQKMEGEAQLAKAESTRRTLVIQAQAEKDSALLRAQAIQIVGQAAKDFPEYRQQEFIGAFAEALHRNGPPQIIYVPTEGNIPVLEAGRRGK